MTHSSPRTVLALRLDRVGDLLCSTPVLWSMHQQWPNARLIVLVSERNQAVLAYADWLTDVLVWPARGFIKRCRVLWQLRRYRPQLCVVLSPKTTAWWLSLLCGAPQRAGLIMQDSRWHHTLLSRFTLTHRCCYQRHSTDQNTYADTVRGHHTEALFSLLQRIGLPSPSHPPKLRLDLPDHYLQSANKLCQALHPAARYTLGFHLDERWVNLIKKEIIINIINNLSEKYDYKILVSTDKYAGELNTKIASQFVSITDIDMQTDTLKAMLDKHTYSNVLVVKGCQFHDWAALLAQCDIVITMEGGCVHTSTAVGTPVIVGIEKRLFTDKHKEWHPWQIAYRALPLDSSLSAEQLQTTLHQYVEDLCHQQG